MRVVVLANGDPGGSDHWGRRQLALADLVIAADGGADTALRWDRPADVVVGDLDSIGAAGRRHAESLGARLERHATAKDQTDTELALLTAKRHGATSIEVIGALGGARLDHALANVFLLALPALRRIPVTLRAEQHHVRLVYGPSRLTLDALVGDVVTLLPLSPTVSGVTTTGLRYPLRDGSLRRATTRGVSNEVTGRRATVRIERGRLLVVVHHTIPPSLTPQTGRPTSGASPRRR